MHTLQCRLWWILTNVYTHVTVNINQNIYSTPETTLFLFCSSQSHPNHPIPGNHLSDFCNYRFILAVLECYLNGIIQSVLFWVWLPLLNVLLRFIQVRLHITSLFFFFFNWLVWIYHNFSMHLPIDEHLTCFQFLLLWTRLLWILCTNFGIDKCFHFSWVNTQKWNCWIVD